MTGESTSLTPDPISRDHLPPSLPTSPFAKRPKQNIDTAVSMTAGSLNGEPLPLLVKKLADTATTPTRGSAFAAGYDLYSAKEAVVPARGKALVDTGVAVAIPVGCYGRVAPRSGLASKHSIDVGAGVIDPDYRGELKVLLFNLSDVDFTIGVGERIAQLVLERIYTPEIVVVDQLDESIRGAGGFGSTGV